MSLLRKIIGYGIILAIYGGIFGAYVAEHGWNSAAGLFLAAAALVGLIMLAGWLIFE